MIIVFILLIFFALLGAFFYKYSNSRATLREGFADFVKELLFANGLWHPYINPLLELSNEDASELVETFNEIFLHPVLLNYESDRFHGWVRIQVGFLEWKEPFRSLPKPKRLKKVSQLVSFFYRSCKGVILNRENIHFVSISASYLEFVLPMNDTKIT